MIGSSQGLTLGPVELILVPKWIPIIFSLRVLLSPLYCTGTIIDFTWYHVKKNFTWLISSVFISCCFFICLVQFMVAGYAVFDNFYSCSEPIYRNCSGLSTPLQKEVSSCCGLCNRKFLRVRMHVSGWVCCEHQLLLRLVISVVVHRV